LWMWLVPIRRTILLPAQTEVLEAESRSHALSGGGSRMLSIATSGLRSGVGEEGEEVG